MTKLVYPAIFPPLRRARGLRRHRPGFAWLCNRGKTLADAILMAEDAASGWVLDELEGGNTAPDASNLNTIQAGTGEFVNLLVLDIDAYAEKYGRKAVRKNLTIPAWLNTFAERQQVNFSQVLTDAVATAIAPMVA